VAEACEDHLGYHDDAEGLFAMPMIEAFTASLNSRRPSTPPKRHRRSPWTSCRGHRHRHRSRAMSRRRHERGVAEACEDRQDHHDDAESLARHAYDRAFTAPLNSRKAEHAAEASPAFTLDTT
jgi:hypothetical protein